MRLVLQAVQGPQHGTRQPMPCPVLPLCMLHAFPQPATPRKVRHGASGRAARAQAEHACPAWGSKLFCRPGGCRPGRPRPATSPYCMAARAHAANSIKTAFTPTHPRRPAQSTCRVRRGGGTPHVARCWEHHAQVLLVYSSGAPGQVLSVGKARVLRKGHTKALQQRRALRKAIRGQGRGAVCVQGFSGALTPLGGPGRAHVAAERLVCKRAVVHALRPGVQLRQPPAPPPLRPMQHRGAHAGARQGWGGGPAGAPASQARQSPGATGSAAHTPPPRWWPARRRRRRTGHHRRGCAARRRSPAARPPPPAARPPSARQSRGRTVRRCGRSGRR